MKFESSDTPLSACKERLILRESLAGDRVEPNERLRLLVYDGNEHDSERKGVLSEILDQVSSRSVPSTTLVIRSQARVDSDLKHRGVDYMILPQYRDVGSTEGEDDHSDVNEMNVGNIRTGAIRAAAEAFAPDILIVDGCPLGTGGELAPTLIALRSVLRTRCVLRSVVGPQKAEGRSVTSEEDYAIRDLYDEIWSTRAPEFAPRRRRTLGSSQDRGM